MLWKRNAIQPLVLKKASYQISVYRTNIPENLAPQSNKDNQHTTDGLSMVSTDPRGTQELA